MARVGFIDTIATMTAGAHDPAPQLLRKRHVADQLRPRSPKLAVLMDDSEHDVLAYMAFPAQHRTKLHSTNPLERLNKGGQATGRCRRLFPNEASITRLIGAVLLEQNDEWRLQCRYMQIEGRAELTLSLIDADRAKLPPRRPDPMDTSSSILRFFHRLDGRDPGPRHDPRAGVPFGHCTAHAVREAPGGTSLRLRPRSNRHSSGKALRTGFTLVNQMTPPRVYDTREGTTGG